MAQVKKYKLGDLEFDTEQEYQQAATDLKRIQSLVAKYDVANPQQAAKILASIRAHPETFRSPYGRRFVEKLESAALKSGAVSPGQGAYAAGNASANRRNAVRKPAAKEKQPKRKRNKEQPPKRSAAKQNQPNEKKSQNIDGESRFQIFTVRNFTIGFIIIVCVVIFSIFAPQWFSMNGGGDSNSDIRTNLVTAYAKNQAALKEQLYTYYFNVVGETEEEAEKDASEGIGHYVLDLSDRTISTMSESEISDIYSQLCDGGDIQNNSFIEPAEISVLKEKLLAAGLANNSGHGVEGETAVVAAINSMMDYQERIFYSLTYGYSRLNYKEEDCEAFTLEDMASMFGEVIYANSMTEEEKQKYFDSFSKKGLIKDNQIVRFSTDPSAYNLPELTPAVEIALKGDSSKSYQCSMISYAPAASVFYEIHSGKETGTICFRNNGKNSKYIPLDEETSVTAQGDFLMTIGKNDRYEGQWFYNNQEIGILLNGDSSSRISMVHDLTY